MRIIPSREQQTGPATDRRRHPRVDVTPDLRAFALPDEQPLVVRDVSVGGFSAESAVKFVVGSQQAFRLFARNGRHTTVLARVAYCAATPLLISRPVYVAGFEFLAQPADNLQLVADIVDAHR
jgi:hypothetical protein